VRLPSGSDTFVVSPAFVADDGETAANCTSLPALTVTNDAGTVLTAPVVDQPVGWAAGVYRAKLTAATHLALLDRLQLVWSGTTGSLAQQFVDVVDVAGAVYVPTSSLRHADISDVAKYPTALLIAARDEFETGAESYRGTAFVPRYANEELIGDGSRTLMLRHLHPRKVRSVVMSYFGTVYQTVPSATVPLSGLDLRTSGILRRVDGGMFPAGYSIQVVYEHGLDQPPPQLFRAEQEYVRSKLLASRAGMRRDTISETVDNISFRYSTADYEQGRPTGLLEVDSLLNTVQDYRIGGLA
jgi:hypothetical protein